jgi:hypothetical protein
MTHASVLYANHVAAFIIKIQETSLAAFQFMANKYCYAAVQLNLATAIGLFPLASWN